ncbi:carbonic anhydrase family protein [Actinomadura rudentiformis]|uniref:carbonic anhydrase n=1 Tax=Actinomadura rudentiformis TaxID=359158 RepID=A0A6H9YVC9_9ACTN|nr:carbonic anhydrase family protein [Actinomadura rudentiformis]KAB2347739.1 carbonic anhydrase family protein [Actinomadura rudentiformis]
MPCASSGTGHHRDFAWLEKCPESPCSCLSYALDRRRMSGTCSPPLTGDPGMSEFNRRELLLKGMGAAAAAAAASYGLRGAAGTLSDSAHAATTPTWNHDPGSLTGPSRWAGIDPGFSACGTGVHQSPINIETARVSVSRGPALQLKYDESELAIGNTGHVIEVRIPSGVEDVLQIGGDSYRLTQYHFHAPSEHTINGRHADVEGHFVHTNAAGATAVVGVLYRIGPRPNRLLETILRMAPETSGTEGRPIGEANPVDLFRGLDGAYAKRGKVQVDTFYSYDGSLTTPSCTENVHWYMPHGSGHVSRAAVTRFHSVVAKFANYGGYANDNRPVQPLNGRVVQLRVGPKRRS